MPQGIQLSQAAAERARRFIERENAAGFRIGVRRTGCSGWAYEVGLAETLEENDTTFESEGITIVVDRKALELIDGTTVDFRSDGLNQTFQFSNPNVTGECGCGESFAVAAG